MIEVACVILGLVFLAVAWLSTGYIVLMVGITIEPKGFSLGSRDNDVLIFCIFWPLVLLYLTVKIIVGCFAWPAGKLSDLAHRYSDYMESRVDES